MSAQSTAQWTTEQILALALDASSAKNGRSLAVKAKWVSFGITQAMVWGECQGSGKNPYRTQIDLSEPAFRCSCPSRKFPCKHGLGLFLLLAESDLISQSDPPDWVVEWVASRSDRREKQAERAEKPEADPAAQAKRAAARQRKVSAGLGELRLWLEDRMRQGLAPVSQEPPAFWDAPAARLVDAQAPGLARQLRDCAGIAHTGSGWHSRLLERLGRLYLIVEGFERIETLPAAVQADLRTQIGWSATQEEVLAGEIQSDLWLVVGQHTEEDDRLRIRRIWLFGLATRRSALLLDFAHGQQPFEQHLLSGTCLEADLAFYPSAFPLRAIVKTRQEAVMLSKNPPGYKSVETAISACAQAFAVCPWLNRFPLLLESVVPLRDGESWLVQDAQGTLLPLSPRLPTQGWQILALSGGNPIALFGEWNGERLLPLSVWAEDSFYGLD